MVVGPSSNSDHVPRISSAIHRRSTAIAAQLVKDARDPSGASSVATPTMGTRFTRSHPVPLSSSIAEKAKQSRVKVLDSTGLVNHTLKPVTRGLACGSSGGGLGGGVSSWL